MDVREKLVELLNEADEAAFQWLMKEETGCNETVLEMIADYLIANGVTVQELVLPEEDYYVLRNTETGMYFRGKGTNRWGKHFNQATIYRVKGTVEFTMKDVAWHGEQTELVRIKIVEMPQPPKGE